MYLARETIVATFNAAVAHLQKNLKSMAEERFPRLTDIEELKVISVLASGCIQAKKDIQMQSSAYPLS